MITSPQTRPDIANVELVGFESTEIARLHKIVNSPAEERTATTFNLQGRATVEAAMRAVDRHPAPVMLCDSDRVPTAWKELLERFTSLPTPPMLIVTSRLADDRLWAEALNLGAYDVLSTPFDSSEALRSLSLACDRWQQRYPA
jgi:DNA-binding NtrC family response regulator